MTCAIRHRAAHPSSLRSPWSDLRPPQP
jgi:hypothetical protein